jgi:hypothetical protein
MNLRRSLFHAAPFGREDALFLTIEAAVTDTTPLFRILSLHEGGGRADVPHAADLAGVR